MRGNAKRIISLCLAVIIAVTTVGYAPPSLAATAMTKSKMEEAVGALASPSQAEENVAETATPSEAESPGDKATPSEAESPGGKSTPSEAIKKFVRAEPEEIPEYYSQVSASGKRFWRFEDRYGMMQYRDYGYMQGGVEFPSWYEADQTGSVETQTIINQDEEFYDLAPYIWTSVKPNEENWKELSEQQYCNIQRKKLLQFENWDETKYGIWHVIVTEKQVEHKADDYDLSEKESYQQKSYDLYFFYGFAQNVRSKDDPKWLESDSNGHVMMRGSTSYQNIMAKMALNVEAESLIPIKFRRYNLNQANSLEEFYDEKVIYAGEWPANNNDYDAMNLWNSDANLENVQFPVLKNDGDIFLGWAKDIELKNPFYGSISADKEYLGQVPQIFRSTNSFTQYFSVGSDSSPISKYNTIPGFPLIPGGTEVEARSFMGPHNSSSDRIYQGVWIPGDKPSLILINGLKDYYGGFGFRWHDYQFFQYSTTMAENVEMVESISVAQNFGDKFSDLKFRKTGSSDLGLPNALTYFYEGYSASNSSTKYYDSRRLVGYFSKPNGMGQKLDANYEFNKVGDKYYAYFVPKTQNFQVEFQDESGNTIRKGQVVPGRAISNPPVAPDKSGYAFNGWVDASGGNSTLTQVLRDTVFKPSYHKEKEERTLTLDTNGGSFANYGGSGSISLQVEVGSGINSIIYGQSENIPSMQDYVFDGWYEQPDGHGRLDDVTENFMPDHDVIYYAHWIKTHKHIVYKDWNGNILKTQKVAIGEAATPPTDPTRTGYTFTGWDQSYTDIQDDTILTAQYSINGYLLTLNGNGGTLEGNAKKEIVISFNQSFDQALRDGRDEAIRPGYYFDGWCTSKSGGNIYSYSGNQMPAANVTDFAHWTPNTYNVIFVADQEQWPGEVIKEKLTFDTELGSLPSPKIYGWTFLGWWTGKNGTGTRITEHTMVEPRDAVYFGNWEPVTYEVCFVSTVEQPNGDSVQPFTIKQKYGQEFGSLPIPEEKGYTFNGWYDADNNKINPHTIFRPDSGADVFTYHAKWKANSYKIRFVYTDADGKQNVVETDRDYFMQLGTLPLLEKPGYTFAGWFNESREKITSESWVEAGNVEYKAKWIANQYTIHFKSNSELISDPKDKTVTYALPIGDFPILYETGYAFLGWYTEPEGGTRIRETTLAALGNQTYYGHWSISWINNGNGTYRRPGADGRWNTADDELWWYGPDGIIGTEDDRQIHIIPGGTETYIDNGDGTYITPGADGSWTNPDHWWSGPDGEIGTSDDKKIDSGNVDPEPTNPESTHSELEDREEEEIITVPPTPIIDSTAKPEVPDTGGTFTVNPNDPLEVTYTKPDGTTAKDEWVGDGKDWYHVDEKGKLNYDWYLEGEKTWYKLNKEPGDRFGAALSGWNYEPMDDKRYFFDPATTKMLTGWQLIDHKWYYFTKQNESQTYFGSNPSGSNPNGWKYDKTKPGKPYGSMYQNERTPDGYLVDENGVWKNNEEE
ncbi:InlB B-repeat-containing protein [Clostridium boliviensis]|uniref:InlB B-repeat-containing protein n=1 Tax=Clostridium boliviensis TaxID=318465 RepID=A0ABU4GMD3_9CLOT|nr:InlB B-repeat-containing protein [Clostridium boliviensis]MDW2798770.1 InlB B-repeat-containing protein [Clostridium boliviensis]